MKRNNYILSTCGTSLLMKQASTPIDSKRINAYSNHRVSDDLPKEDRDWLSSLLNQAQEKLMTADISAVARMSAELNGLILYYDGVIDGNHKDYHLLLCSDTWIGEKIAEMEAEWLRQHFPCVEVKRQLDLQTAEHDSFQLALSDMVKWCEDTLPAYRDSRYKIVFNLTGGFKSVNGFLQTLAMFYADETIYVFESGKELLKIPRLPITLSADAAIRQHLLIFRRLALGLDCESAEGIAETFLLSMGDQVTLSPWGNLIWESTKRCLYSEKLLPPPSTSIGYALGFQSSLDRLRLDRIRIINERIDDLARYLESGGKVWIGSFDFKKLAGNPSPPSTHEIDAWSDQDAKRLFGHYEGKLFVLDRLGKHL